MDDFLPVTPTETLMPFGSNGMSPLEGLRLFHHCLIQSWFWLQYRDSNTLYSAEKLMLWCFYCILVWLVVSYLKGYKSEETSLSQKEVCWLFVVQIDLKYYIRGGDWFALFPHSITLPRTNVWSFTNVLLLPPCYWICRSCWDSPTNSCGYSASTQAKYCPQRPEG